MSNRFCRPEKLLSCFFVVFILLFRMAASAPAEEIRKPEILILNSYHQGVDWTDGIMDGILSCFKKEKLDADLYIEYMDTKRNRPDNIFPSLIELYKLKYQKKKFDVIICSDNNALNFLLRHREPLFPNVPIVFCGINNFRDSLIAGKKQITGVTEDHDIKGTIELALRLHPETEHVAVICDNTPTGLADMEKLKPILFGFHEKVDFIKIFEFTGKELQQKLQSLPENTVVFSLTFFVDRDGKFYSLEESSALLAKSCDRPIYVVADFRIRNGVLGGIITRAKSQGGIAAEIAVRILKGESVDAIPVLQKGQNIPMFDYKFMKRFGIKVSDLPKDSVVMNEPFSFYDRYKGLIWAAALIISVLLAIVLILIGNIIKRRRTEEALRESEEKYRKLSGELEQSVQKRTAQLEAANKELESFAYSVSHDLRAPLRGIDGFSQALLEDCEERLNEEGKDYLARIRSGAQRMGHLIDDLLRLSRLTRAELRYEAVNLSKAAEEILKELRESAPEREVKIEITPNLNTRGDRYLLRVALENLLGNAWKFTSSHDRARIEFGVEKFEGKNAYFVRDDGVGFDMTYADKLFGAFQRLHGTTEFPGSGIGLATVQRIIHRHEGRIWAKSEVGKGSTFYFTL